MDPKTYDPLDAETNADPFPVFRRLRIEDPVHYSDALGGFMITRHADAVDIKFLANGRPVWIALPHAAWAEYKRRTGRVITDPLAIQIAGHFLKTAIESGLESGREMYMLTVAETLEHLDVVMREKAA